MQMLIRNLQYAMRQLGKSPVFTLAAVLTLALGIGANTAIFTVVYSTLLAPMPYPQPDQLVMVWSKIQGWTVIRLQRRISSTGNAKANLFRI